MLIDSGTTPTDSSKYGGISQNPGPLLGGGMNFNGMNLGQQAAQGMDPGVGPLAQAAATGMNLNDQSFTGQNPSGSLDTQSAQNPTTAEQVAQFVQRQQQQMQQSAAGSPYPSDYGQQLQNDKNASQQYTNLQNLYQYYAPELAQYGLDQNTAMMQFGLNQAGYQNQANYLGGQYGIDTQQNALQQQGVRMDQGLYQSLIPMHQQIMDINNQQSANYGSMNTNLSSEQQNIAKMQGNITGQSGNLDQQLQNTLAHLQTQADTAQRGVKNQFAAGGNWFSPEHGAQTSDINTNLAQGQTGARLGTEYQQLGLQNQNLDLSNNSLGISNQMLGNINNILSNQQANINQNMSIADLQNKIGHTGLDLQSLGLDRQGLDLKLNNGLSQLGLSNSMDSLKVYNMMASSNIQLAQLGRNIMLQAIQMSGGK